MNYINSKNELYDKCENMEELYDRYYLYLLSQYELTVSENQKLKKQLENCYCNRTDCSARIKDSKQYDSLVQKVENQQKEFIEYMEDKLSMCDSILDTIKSDLEEVSYVGRASGKTYIATQIMKND